jgi:uncharacterized membrane protein YhiD involved in acid resistance
MAIGGGLYLTGVFATVAILVGLFVLGRLERALKLRSQLTTYEAVGDSPEQAIAEINRILDLERQAMQTVTLQRTDGGAQVHFTVDTTRREHELLLRRLQQSTKLRSVTSLGAAEQE